MALCVGDIKTRTLIEELEDFYIANLAMGLCTANINTETLCIGDRIIKYNHILRIKEGLGA